MTRALSSYSLLLVALFSVSCCSAWSPIPFGSFSKNFGSNVQHSILDDSSSSDEQKKKKEAATFESRRKFLTAAAMNVCLMGAAAVPAEYAVAADEESTVYRSGKTPIVPGKKPKDKNDLKGTRKDPDFLRSVADCRSQCQNTPASDGYSRTKEDCLSECQDICCQTYEQCTFNIVPRL